MTVDDEAESIIRRQKFCGDLVTSTIIGSHMVLISTVLPNMCHVSVPGLIVPHVGPKSNHRFVVFDRGIREDSEFETS